MKRLPSEDPEVVRLRDCAWLDDMPGATDPIEYLREPTR